ncbi:hypothetical protein JTB14_030146 [Gonioctena quinquepunctata]|nr:hypothetical protein JTB14_030146 [Gonioctena quinquepunctata]
MNRSLYILELALRNSGRSPERETEQDLLSSRIENLEHRTTDVDITENFVLPSTSRQVSDPVVIESGNDLIQFKENLRPHLSSCLNQEYVDLESSTEQEPFSAVESSEYVPSDEENSCSNESEEKWQLDVSQQNVKLNTETEYTVTNAEQQKSKQKRNMPLKCTPGRKRKRNTDDWKCNINRKKKKLGLEFTNQQGKLIRKKQMKPGCNNNCSRKCSQKLSLIKSQIFSEFWALGNHNDQVCKKMFFDTLDITDKWVGTIYHKIDKQESQCVSLNDQRGHHVNRPNKVSDVIEQSVRIHISQIPVVDSHYVRARSAKQYFDESLTFVKLYQLYKAWLQDNQYEPEIKATERQYREVFYNEFNIDFFKPKKDLCLTCDIYKRASIEERESLQLNYTFHIASK